MIIRYCGRGWRYLVNRERDLVVCGEAEEAQTAMREIAAKNPDILIADISLNGPDGLDLLKNLRMLISESSRLNPLHA